MPGLGQMRSSHQSSEAVGPFRTQRALAKVLRPVAGMLAATAVLVSAWTPAAAQSREVFIGATGGARVGSERGRPEIELLQAAEHDIARGRFAAAQRSLETIIERRPDSREADEARRLLAPIYAAPFQPPSTRRDSQRGRTLNAGTRAVGGSEPFAPSAGGPDTTGAQGSSVETLPRHFAVTRVAGIASHEFQSGIGDRVFFGDGSVEVGTKSRAVLAAQAQWLNRHPAFSVAIEAHADDRASPEQNVELSLRRADAVRQRLIEEGLDASRIRVASHGRAHPVAPCNNPDCAAQNRRVVTVLVEPSFGSITPAGGRPFPRTGFGRGDRN